MTTVYAPVSLAVKVGVSVTIVLNKNWNILVVPLPTSKYMASTLGLATGDMVASWNSLTQKYDHSYIKGITPSSTDFAIAPNTGYWVWVAKATTLVFSE